MEKDQNGENENHNMEEDQNGDNKDQNMKKDHKCDNKDRTWKMIKTVITKIKTRIKLPMIKMLIIKS